jgi:protein TonB
MTVAGAGIGNGSGSGTGSGHGNGDGEGKGSGIGGLFPDTSEPVQISSSEIRFQNYLPPNYPERAKRAGIHGDVVVRVTIDEEGHPVEFNVTEGPAVLAAEAMKVVARWRFAPVMIRGRKVRATFPWVVRFNLA